MADRDDFAASVKRALAARAGHRCSRPDCRAPTAGPSDEGPTAQSNVGVACHITAAARGGKRYDKEVSRAERASIDNGIWMCGTHGHEIDTDAVRFPEELLRRWKRDAEAFARAVIGRPSAHDGGMRTLIQLPPAVVERHNINTSIGRALAAAGAGAVWGEPAHAAVRDVLIETAKNAVAHGGASAIEFEVRESSVTLRDDGAEFDPHFLREGDGRGGKAALAWLEETCATQLFVTYSRHDGRNVLTIASLADAHSLAHVPCTFILSEPHVPRDPPLEVPLLPDCSTVHVVLPEFMSLSDVGALAVHLALTWDRNRRVVFVLRSSSPHAQVLLRDMFPRAEFVDLDSPR